MTELLEAGVHYGHQTKRWNPRMRDFILEEKNSIHIIDLSKTVEQLVTAGKFLSEITGRGGKILFVGCKKQAQEAVKEAAQASGQFYVNQRWLGGTLTNLVTIRKSVSKLKDFEALEKSAGFNKINKAEASALRREATRIRKNLEGVLEMEKLPDAIVIIDTVKESIAVAEARRLNIPIVAVVDSNSNPEEINYPIAGNDDAIRAIRIILQKLVDVIAKSRGASVAAVAAVAE
jgi:small subunit ribosomal protein S2